MFWVVALTFDLKGFPQQVPGMSTAFHEAKSPPSREIGHHIEHSFSMVDFLPELCEVW